jgi:disulfide bond formation protein DsbB
VFTSVTTTLAVLALVALALCVISLVALTARSVRPAAWAALRTRVSALALPCAWVAAVIAVSGSLYLSDVAGLTPCRLCWYQRIAMYPLVVLLGIAALRRDTWTARRYLLPVAGLGAIISAYHYQLERFPQETSFSCSLEAPCNAAVVDVWGFVSVPFMALAAFLLIASLLALARDPDPAPEA